MTLPLSTQTKSSEETVALKATSVVVCDDIRQEMSGKHILIGVYQGAMLVRGFPFDVALAWWILASPSNKGIVHIDLRVVGASGNVLFQGASIRLDVRDAADTAIAVPPLPLQLQSPDQLSFQWRVREGTDSPEWETIARLRVAAGGPPRVPAT